jgi:hypothetical protein
MVTTKQNPIANIKKLKKIKHATRENHLASKKHNQRRKEQIEPVNN